METIGELIASGVISNDTPVVGGLPLSADGCIVGRGWPTFIHEKTFNPDFSRTFVTVERVHASNHNLSLSFVDREKAIAAAHK